MFDDAGLTGVKLSYAADWSEYHSHRPDDGSNDIYYNMDPLWGDPDCDYIAIDNYMPLSDFRDGQNHEDFGTGDVTAYATTGGFCVSWFPSGDLYMTWNIYKARSRVEKATTISTPVTQPEMPRPGHK